MDREKVIKGWECHMEAETLGCADCPYRQGWRTCNFADTLFKDVYALLKEQEAIIRCKDCKHGEECVKPNKDYWCHLYGIYQYGDWFCSDGERKSAE